MFLCLACHSISLMFGPSSSFESGSPSEMAESLSVAVVMWITVIVCFYSNNPYFNCKLTIIIVVVNTLHNVVDTTQRIVQLGPFRVWLIMLLLMTRTACFRSGNVKLYLLGDLIHALGRIARVPQENGALVTMIE